MSGDARRSPRPTAGRRASLMVLGVFALSLLSVGCSEDRTPEATTSDTARPGADECRSDMLACAHRTTLADLVPAEATEATGEPLVLGMINQENTPVGSFPELSGAVRAGMAFINEQLGGVDGRPLEIQLCNTEFSAEGSTACAQEMVDAEVPAVLGGIDVFGTGIDTLDDNEIPFVGGIPVSDLSVTTPTSFQWSGGSWGAALAFADHAGNEPGAQRASIVYADFGPIADAADYARTVLEADGVDVQLVPMPVVATDLGSPISAADSTDPDAIFVLTADSGCKAAFDAAATIGTEAQLYFVGACASPTITAQLPAERVEGTIFNVEGEVHPDEPDPDTVLYNAVVETYGDGLDPIGAGTVTFRSLMNLYRILREVDEITPAAITDELAAQVATPSFMGHDYTCDGHQLAGLPSLCSPQQVLVRMHDGALEQLGTWIDVGAVYAAATD